MRFQKFVYIILTFCFTLGTAISFSQESMSRAIICWDISHSMKDRNTEAEFQFLEEYFTSNPDLAVTLLLFSNTIVDKKEYKVNAGRWGLIKEKLSTVNYDGATSYSDLSEFATEGDILLFTDGHQNTNSSSPSFAGKLYVINSKKNFNQANLNLLTILNNGTLVNLAEKKKTTNQEPRQYFGTIQGSQISGRQVEISIRGKEDSAIQPEDDGTYRINAREGDTMIVTTAAGERIEKTLGTSANIDIWLGGTGEIALEEVVVTGVQEEPVEEKITALGPKNADAVGYAVQSITDEDISDISVTVNNATQGKFSGVRLGQNDDLSQVIMRPSNSINSTNYGLIVVDGVPLQRADSSDGVITGAGPFQIPQTNPSNPNDTSRSSAVPGTGFLNPQNIANITVLKGLAATNRFGSMGANGVILITTKTSTVAGGRGTIKDLALLTDNIYDGKLKVSSKTLVTPYLKALKRAKNLEEAYIMYLEQRAIHSGEPAFYIDVFEYFYASSKPLAVRILSNILEEDDINYSTLRAMLFKTQQYNMEAMELETASRLIEKFPQKTQSYFDLAMAHKANGNFQKCLDQLLKISDGTANSSLDFNGLKKPTKAEIKNLVFQRGGELDLSKINPEFRKNLTYNARVAIDWNHAPAEFELQFVNPQKRFFTWEHTSLVNPDRIQDEIDKGYSREDFEIVGQETIGKWLINVKYRGNMNESDQTPTFLRCRVQTDFGLSSQKEQVYTIRLHEVDSEEQFIELSIE